MKERLFRGDGFEHERLRREDFDPIAEGKRYGLAPDMSAAIWDHVRREATNRDGLWDEDRARERFAQLAESIAERGGKLGPAPFKSTQVEVAASSNATVRNELADPVPGRMTRMLARVSGYARVGLRQDLGRTTLAASEPDSDLCAPEDSLGFVRRYVSGGHAALSKLETAIASHDHYAALAATISLQRDLKWARRHLANGLAHDEGLRREITALEGRPSSFSQKCPT